MNNSETSKAEKKTDVQLDAVTGATPQSGDVQTTKGDKWLWILLSFLIIGVTILVYVFGVNVWAVQVLSACIGAVITIIATRLLLSKQAAQQQELQNRQNKQQQELQSQQTELQDRLQREHSEQQQKFQQELQLKQIELQSKLQREQSEKQQEFQQLLFKKQEEKDKQIKTYEKKIEVYSEFINSMWNITPDGTLDEETLATLRNQIFNKLIFYLNDENLEKNKGFLEKQTSTNKPKAIEFYAQVTNLLKSELSEQNEKIVDNTQKVLGLWNIITNRIEELNKKQSTIEEIEQTEKEQILKCQTWHFTMLDPDIQIKKLPEIKELSLIEYNGEQWRTNLVQQVKDNDIIFLFRKGGNGYVGAFRAKGWRIFDINAKKEVIMFGGEMEEKTGDDYKKDVILYDIYESDADGGDWCANIIVEPIAFKYDGVGNPGGVYRRTISRYYDQYAIKLLELFSKAKNDSSYGMLDEKTKIELVKDELI